jgi:hypothetical protein
MSTLWTPGGERPVGREPEAETAEPPDHQHSADEPSPEEVEAMVAQMQEQLLGTPAGVIARDHAATFHQLAVLHLSQDTPNFSETAVAIDAMAALVNGLGERMADHDQLEEALNQLKAAFVEIKSRLESPDRANT